MIRILTATKNRRKYLARQLEQGGEIFFSRSVTLVGKKLVGLDDREARLFKNWEECLDHLDANNFKIVNFSKFKGMSDV